MSSLFYFQFQHLYLIIFNQSQQAMFSYNQTQQALSVEDEGGAGVSGGSGDERGKLGRADTTPG